MEGLKTDRVTSCSTKFKRNVLEVKNEQATIETYQQAMDKSFIRGIGQIIILVKHLTKLKRLRASTD